ncbi:hypothetical protein ACWGDS_13015 [Streptomyces sp. NPDC055059]|uniref:SAM-dependent methyltransferase n=1 Tax=Streptomyces sp. NBC_00119 TaxID=2975659 RepID=A0AAU1U2Y2_9ACTN|nr:MULTISPECIES: hypothetical protein [unclassified Streptomyces]MCX4641184.1 SAM-dependent methyltransferase [Streptomyces sp. NBC_01446]MCX5322399.1 SAM-dependent methyltransferase [Streptomyces sp. NBC_00120]
MGEIPPPSVDRIDTSKPHPARVYDWSELGVDEVRNGSPVPLYAGVARKP